MPGDGGRRRPRDIWRFWCAPGLEELVATEIATLTGAEVRTAHAAVTARLTTREAYVAIQWSRVAERALVRGAMFDARDWPALQSGLAAVGWSAWLSEDTPLRLRVKANRSRLAHEGRIAQAVRGAAAEAIGSTALLDEPVDDAESPQLVDVAVSRDRVTVWIDASGEGLDRRGWRADTGKAPLRPTIAAAALVASEWDGRAPLLDPFVGSGTVVVEAARWAAGRRPWVEDRRDFGVWAWPCFEPGTWASAGASRGQRADAPLLVGRDRNAGAIAASTDNLVRAGSPMPVDLATGSISALEPPPGPPGWIVTNPPWGERTASRSDPRDVWAAFGQVLTRRFGGWRVTVLSPSHHLVHATGLTFREAFTTSAGGRRIRAHRVVVPG